MSVVDDLLRRELLERVPEDSATAAKWLDDVERHLEAAVTILDVDLSGAYTLCYDAGRKAVAAVMLAEGLRVRAVPGSHQAVARYADAMAADGEEELHLARLDAMRRNRNRSEYGHRVFGRDEVEFDLEHARGIVAIARRRLFGS